VRRLKVLLCPRLQKIDELHAKLEQRQPKTRPVTILFSLRKFEIKIVAALVLNASFSVTA
jgi:hypothetical protein